MERMTYKQNNCYCISGRDGRLTSDKHANYWGKAIDRLAYYEDMEEQGRLVVLPCKLEADIFRLGVKEVCAHWQVAYAEVFPDEIVMVDDSDNVFTEKDIGKTVFLTREEAEKAFGKE